MAYRSLTGIGAPARKIDQKTISQTIESRLVRFPAAREKL
jgi:hypothetical protein